MGLNRNHGSRDLMARLCAAREASALSLRQIADSTKLSVRTLDALEKGRVSQLPAGIYRRSIVRTYAREVGLDPEIILREFLIQFPDDLPALPPLATCNPTSHDVPPDPKPRREHRRTIAAILGVVGAMIPIAWRRFQSSRFKVQS